MVRGLTVVLMSATIGMAFAALPAPEACADSPRETAISFARSAEALGREGDFDGAIRLFQKAYDLACDPVLLYNIARMHDRKGDLRKAREFYERYLREEKDEEGRARGRGKLEALLDRIPGILVVTTEPPDAEIEIDGKEAGRSPIRIETKRGSHTVHARLDGRRPGSAKVDVAAGEETREFLALEPATEALMVRCDCPGSKVELDGKLLGTGVLERTEQVLPGRHTVRVVLPAGKPLEQGVDVALGNPGRIDVACPGPGERPIPGGGVATAWTRPFPWQWVAIGSGVVIVAGGGLLTGLAARDRSRISGAATYPDGTVRLDSLSRPRALALRSRADTLDKASYALYAAGGAAVIAGFVLWAVLPSRGSGTTAVSACPMEGGVQIGASGRF